jgi:hypothetical protein
MTGAGRERIADGFVSAGRFARAGGSDFAQGEMR